MSKFFAFLLISALIIQDNIGQGGVGFLEDNEAILLNSVFKETRGHFDFCGKRVMFLSNGKNNKSGYFEMQKDYMADASCPYDKGILYVFNEEQKTRSGGYDAAILYWSKIALPINDVVKKVKKQSRYNALEL